MELNMDSKPTAGSVRRVESAFERAEREAALARFAARQRIRKAAEEKREAAMNAAAEALFYPEAESTEAARPNWKRRIAIGAGAALAFLVTVNLVRGGDPRPCGALASMVLTRAYAEGERRVFNPYERAGWNIGIGLSRDAAYAGASQFGVLGCQARVLGLR